MSLVADRPAAPAAAAPPAVDPAAARSGGRMVRRSLVLGCLTCGMANLVAVVAVFSLGAFVLPKPEGIDQQLVLNLVVTATYTPIALGLGLLSCIRRSRRDLRWLREGRPADDAGRRAVVGLPLALTWVQVRLWAVAALLVGLLNGRESVLFGVEVALTTLIGGLIACTSTYFLAERVNRPLVARALDDAPLRPVRGTGVACRATLAWLVGTGLPLSGLALLGGVSLVLDVEQRELALATFVLSLTALAAGLSITVVQARSVADPLRALRQAVARVAGGDVAVRVPVTDTSELGVLQSGFNHLVDGLAERDRLRDLFGRHVGREVARRALEEGVELGGEVRHVGVVFVDVTGSTGLAEAQGPERAVEQLNHLFGLVVDVVESEGGTVTAFAGDAAVCVFGAPAAHPAPATGALAAARRLAAAVAADPRALPVGIGVAAGPVVAGNVGARHRVEYTVIGDAVNCAARLSDLAKERGVVALASAEAVADAAEAERRRWRSGDEPVTIRGRAAPARVAELLG
jgi:adenylate cyclase